MLEAAAALLIGRRPVSLAARALGLAPGVEQQGRGGGVAAEASYEVKGSKAVVRRGARQFGCLGERLLHTRRPSEDRFWSEAVVPE